MSAADFVGNAKIEKSVELARRQEVKKITRGEVQVRLNVEALLHTRARERLK